MFCMESETSAQAVLTMVPGDYLFGDSTHAKDEEAVRRRHLQQGPEVSLVATPWRLTPLILGVAVEG